MSASDSPSPTSMAATMGFTSFGSKPNHPKKKQKLSANSTGSNEIPLGVRSKELSGTETVKQQRNPQGLPKMKDDAVANETADASGKGLPMSDFHASANGRTKSTGQTEGDLGNWIPTSSHNAMNEKQNVEENNNHGFTKGAEVTWDWQALRKGIKDENGDVAFYDQSFVEDPWRELRREEGKG
ncbi:hypothetical protein ACLMJK_007460 [Lecanora helva]